MGQLGKGLASVYRGLLEEPLPERLSSLLQRVNETTKRRDEALIYLRLRKHLEKQLSQRLGVLENLHSMLTEVDMAATNIEVKLPDLFSCDLLRAFSDDPLPDYEGIRTIVEYTTIHPFTSISATR